MSPDGTELRLNLTEDELVLYREWIENNRELERLVNLWSNMQLH